MAGIQYVNNKKQAKKDEANRPIYQIPAEATQGLSMAEQQALEGLPEAQKQQYVSNLQRSASYALGQNQTRKGGLTNIAALNENQNTGYANLMAQDAAARFQRQGRVYDQLGNIVNEKEQQWQLNKENPYYEQSQRAQANRGSAYRNVGNAAQLGLYGAGSMKAQNTQVQAPTNQQFGGGGLYNGTFGQGTEDVGGLQSPGTQIG